MCCQDFCKWLRAIALTAAIFAHKLLRSPQVPDSLLNIEYTYFGIPSYLKNHQQFSVHVSIQLS
ncbi:hypothetical protein H6G93_25335 [Nostoc sp. FACHB-973]|nr:hypothetical protein [Nostoc sp. FACHB-973]